MVLRYPVGQKPRKKLPALFQLYAANLSPINADDNRTLKINLGHGKNFEWSFILADVPYAIMSADFMVKFALLIDLKSRCLQHSDNSILCRGVLGQGDILGIAHLDAKLPVTRILEEFPSLFKEKKCTQTADHGICHYIDTYGPPLAQRARRLCPEKLAAAKNEFKKLLDLGYVQPSKSPWSSPIHLVRKKDDTWRDNSVADALSHIDSLVSPSTFDLSFDKVDNNLGCQSDIAEVQTFSSPTLFKCEELSDLEAQDEVLKGILANSEHELKLVKLRLGNTDRYLYCNVQGNIIRPAAPKNKASLVQPFTEPHRVIKRQKDLKYFLIDYNGKKITVSAESVKPAFMVQEDVPPDDPPVPVFVERLEVDQTSSGGEVPSPSSVLTPTRQDGEKVPVVLPPPPKVAPTMNRPTRRVKFVSNILRPKKRLNASDFDIFFFVHNWQTMDKFDALQSEVMSRYTITKDPCAKNDLFKVDISLANFRGEYEDRLQEINRISTTRALCLGENMTEKQTLDVPVLFTDNWPVLRLFVYGIYVYFNREVLTELLNFVPGLKFAISNISHSNSKTTCRIDFYKLKAFLSEDSRATTIVLDKIGIVKSLGPDYSHIFDGLFSGKNVVKSFTFSAPSMQEIVDVNVLDRKFCVNQFLTELNFENNQLCAAFLPKIVELVPNLESLNVVGVRPLVDVSFAALLELKQLKLSYYAGFTTAVASIVSNKFEYLVGINSLGKRHTKLQRKSRSNRSSSSAERPLRARSQSKPRFGPDKNLCYYHFHFLKDARRCSTPPCTWETLDPAAKALLNSKARV
ncbi:hypothetical protein TKK_0016998 [Trichogramma kaykai]